MPIKVGVTCVVGVVVRFVGVTVRVRFMFTSLVLVGVAVIVVVLYGDLINVVKYVFVIIVVAGITIKQSEHVDVYLGNSHIACLWLFLKNSAWVFSLVNYLGTYCNKIIHAVLSIEGSSPTKYKSSEETLPM